MDLNAWEVVKVSKGQHLIQLVVERLQNLHESIEDDQTAQRVDELHQSLHLILKSVNPVIGLCLFLYDCRRRYFRNFSRLALVYFARRLLAERSRVALLIAFRLGE